MDAMSAPMDSILTYKKMIRLIVVLSLLMTAANGHIQSAQAGEQDHNGNLWINYFGDAKLGASPFGIHMDAQIRRDQLGKNQQQYLVQPGVTYKLAPNWDCGVGYGYMRTYPYGEFPIASPVPEHRVWEQISTKLPLPIGNLKLDNRLRLEQRHLGMAQNNDHTTWRYENRFRYRLLTTFPIPYLDSDRYYCKASDEIFLNFGQNVAKNHFDQNRLYLALGKKITDDWKVECGFMEQTLQHRDGKVTEHNHTVMISFFHNFELTPADK